MRILRIFAVVTLFAAPVWALKYAAREHRLTADPALPSWKPAELTIAPEEELNLVGADVMDEMTLGWVMAFRKAYPRLSVTMEARASGSGGPALTEGRAHLAPVGREMLPAEEKAFVDKYGYPPLAIKVATGSVGSLGKTATSVFFVDKDNPVRGLTMAQLDAIYSKTRKRGHAEIRTWGDVGVSGEWAARPIHLYGLKPVNGIEQFLKQRVLLGGDYRDGIQFVKGKGFTHAFTVAAEDMAHKPGGITYALLSNVTPGIKVLPIAAEEGAPFVEPTIENVYTHRYPLSRFVYLYVNRPPGKPLPAKVKEFLSLVLSREGQEVVAREGVYIPLTPDVTREERARLE